MKEPILLFSTPTSTAPAKRKPKRKIKSKLTLKDKVVCGLLLAVFVCLALLTITHAKWGSISKQRQHIPDETLVAGAPRLPEEGARPDWSMFPVINKAALRLESINNTDFLRIVVNEQNKKDSPVNWTYEWSRNGEVVSQEQGMTGFKRGDTVMVKVTPFVGETSGRTKTITMEIKNTPPKIAGPMEVSREGDVLTCAVKASDPDDDTLSYSLANAPAGMTIDSGTGLLRWPLKTGNAGKCHVEVKVSDGHGGETAWLVDIDPTQLPGQ